MPKSLLNDAQYVAKQVLCCPSCLHTDIKGGSVNIEGGIAAQTVGCNNCNAEWTDVYRLTGFTNFESE